jgi:dTDP-4-dehydrorhamnose reductase
MKTRKCRVTGAGGLMGHAVVHSPWMARGWEAIGLDRGKLDLMDDRAVERRFGTEMPDALIHCAAMSRSPACQREPALARRVNIEVTHRLAGLFGGRPMVFLSTDLVFDGRAAPYREDAATAPLSVYGETKVDAEGCVLADPGHLVVRTSLNHGRSPTGDRGFNEEMHRAWSQGTVLDLFVDEHRCPIGAEVTARALWRLLEVGAAGVVHVAGTERLSRWEMGCLLAGKDEARRALVRPASIRDYPGARRPPDTTLDVTRAQSLLGWELPRYSEWLGTVT